MRDIIWIRERYTLGYEILNPHAKTISKSVISRSLWGWPIAVLLAITGLTALPYLFGAIPSGHDFEFHMNSWMEMLGQWKEGVVYPAWSGLAHYGYGEPRFIFYPPISRILGATLGALLPWTIVPAVYVWIALFLSGCSMFCLCRQWLHRNDAILAAAFYAMNPYYLIVVFWRSAFAELLAGALLPLLALFALKAGKRRTSVLPLALIVGAAWLTDVPAAIIATYSLLLLAMFSCARTRSARSGMEATSAIALGAALAAFYLVPAVYEQKWINIDQVLAPGVRPADNFVFTRTGDSAHDRFNLFVSIVAISEMLMVAGATIISKAWKRRTLAGAAMMTLGLVPALLMFPVSMVAWKYFPELKFVQLPWRWLLPLNMAFAFLLNCAHKRWAGRILGYALILAALAVAGLRVQPPWWDRLGDVRQMSIDQKAGLGYEGADEYVPAPTDGYDISQAAPLVAGEAGSSPQIQIQQWGSHSKRFAVSSALPAKVELRLFNYPAWKVDVDGRPIFTETADVTGQMVIPMKAGISQVTVTFTRTWDRTTGIIISCVTAMVLIGSIRYRRRKPTAYQLEVSPNAFPRVLIATSNAGKLRDFAAAAKLSGMAIEPIPNFDSLPAVVEDGLTFEANARKKAEAYSMYASGELVLADDSGLEVDGLGGAPGVHSARYATDDPSAAGGNSDDDANNLKLMRALAAIPLEKRGGRFVCVIAAASDGKTLATFRGSAEGILLEDPRGSNGFGYDPLFYFPQIQKTFAELSAEEKAAHSHRGAALRQFVAWYRTNLWG